MTQDVSDELQALFSAAIEAVNVDSNHVQARWALINGLAGNGDWVYSHMKPITFNVKREVHKGCDRDA